MDGATHRSTASMGTITHMAPEVLRSGHMSAAGDVYSFGIMSECSFSFRAQILCWHCLLSCLSAPGDLAALARVTGHLGSPGIIALLPDGLLSSVDFCNIQQSGCRDLWLAEWVALTSPLLETHCLASCCCRVAVWELYTNQSAHAGLHYGAVVERVVVRGERPPVPSNMPTEYAMLMQNCWEADAAKRPTFTQLLQCMELLLDNLTSDSESRISEGSEDCSSSDGMHTGPPAGSSAGEAEALDDKQQRQTGFSTCTFPTSQAGSGGQTQSGHRPAPAQLGATAPVLGTPSNGAGQRRSCSE